MFGHQAHGLRLGFRISERPTHCNDICHHLRKAVPRSGNDTRDVCIQHSPDRLRLRHSLPGFISPSLRPPSLPSSLTLGHTVSFIASALALIRSIATRSTVVNHMFNNNSACTHPCRGPCPTPNYSLNIRHRPSGCAHAFHRGSGEKPRASLVVRLTKRARPTRESSRLKRMPWRG